MPTDMYPLSYSAPGIHHHTIAALGGLDGLIRAGLIGGGQTNFMFRQPNPNQYQQQPCSAPAQNQQVQRPICSYLPQEPIQSTGGRDPSTESAIAVGLREMGMNGGPPFLEGGRISGNECIP